MGVNLLMIAHFLQWRFTGRTVSPIEPSESMQTLQQGAINAGFIFFALALLATLIFGRFVCGWGCHILALQDLCGWMMKRIGITPRPFRSRLLMFVPLLAALYMFVWPTFHRLFLNPEPHEAFPAFTNHTITSDFWSTFPTIAVAIPFLLICGFATVYFLGAKGFCTYACPYGGFFGLLDNFSPARIRANDSCIDCGHCTAVCTSNVAVAAEVKSYKAVVDPGCMKCMDCVSVCPTDALFYGFGAPAVTVRKESTPRHYSLSWPEEIAAALVFVAALLAIRGAYGLIPFLMALGAAAVTTFLLIRSWQLLRVESAKLHQTPLKTLGILHPAGRLFLTAAAILLVLVAHTGWIRYHEWRGESAFLRLQVPDELALAQANPAPWISPPDAQTIADGRAHLRTVTRSGLLTNPEALAKLAWFTFLSGQPEAAIDLLDRAALHQHGNAQALSHYYAGAILNRLGRYADAQSRFKAALQASDNLLSAWEELGVSEWQLGRPDEAIAQWQEALRRNPRLPLANWFLAEADVSLGKGDGAAEIERANQSTPDFAAYHWMLALRLQNLGFNEAASAHFARARVLDPSFAQ